jgi:hypothetical protein
LLGTAEWMDSFFVDERVIEEENRTRLMIGLAAAIRADDGVEFDEELDLRLTLPNTEDRLRLLIFGSANDEPGIARTGRGGVDEEVDRRRGDRLSTALQYFFRSDDRRSISLRGGLRFNDLPPVVFVGPRYRETIELDSWTFRFTESIRWFSDDGWESRTTLDFERELPWDELFFRATPYGSWFEDENGFFYGTNFSLFQPFSERRAMEYQWLTEFQTRPSNRLEETTLRLRYRQRLWRDWLVVEVAPELAFPRDEDFGPTPGIVLGFDVIFGNFWWDRDMGG